MIRKWALATGVAALAALIAVAACSSGGNQPRQTTSGTTTSTSAAQPHNQADMTFAQQMIPAHQQAVQTSEFILAKQGIDPRVTDLASQIKATQGAEIQQMQGWLSQWGQPVPMAPSCTVMPSSTSASSAESPGATTTASTTAAPSGAPTASSTVTPSCTMSPSAAMTPGLGKMPAVPGMASAQEITALQNSEGVDASKMFLTLMIKHHQGEITVAQTEVKTGQNPPAIAMARSIISRQQQQIATMQNVLASL